MTGMDRAKVDFGKDQEVILRLEGQRGTAALELAMLKAGYLAPAATVEEPAAPIEPGGNALLIEKLQERISFLEEVLDDRVPGRLLISDILKATCLYYRVSRTDMLSRRRNRSIARPRQVAMYLARVLTDRSLPEIGQKIGGKDHTTVLHAIRKVKELLQTDAEIRADVAAIKAKLTA
jgi:hypothetical protein